MGTGWSYQPAEADAHTVIRVLVAAEDTDGSGTAQAEAYSAWQAIANTAPEIAGESHVILIDEDHEGSVTLTASDADLDTLAWSVLTQAAHGSASVAEDTGSASYSPLADFNGSDTFTIEVADAFGGTDSASVNVSVAALNDYPTFTVGENQTVEEDCEAQSVSSWIAAMSPGPADESKQTLIFTVTGNTNEPLFSAAPAVSALGTLTYTPAADANGSAVITLAASDSAGAENPDTQSFTITVNAVNDAPRHTVAPVINGTPHNGQTLSASNGTWSDSADGANATELSFAYQWQKAPANAGPWSDISGASTAAYTLTADENDLYIEDVSTGAIGFTIADVDTSLDSCSISVLSDNPVLVPNDGTHISTGGTGANRTLTIVPALNEYGTADITVTVSDGSLTNDSTFTLTVDAANDKPTISAISAKTIDEDTTTGAVALTVADVDNPISDLTISAAANNTSLVPRTSIALSAIAQDGTASITVTPVANYNGTSTITVTVKDASGDLSTSSFLLTVNPVNDPPTIGTIASQSTNEDTNKSISVSIGDIDTLASQLTLTAIESTNTALVPLDDEHIVITGSTNTRSVLIKPLANQNGITYITLKVTDGGDVAATSTFKLEVSEVNDSPYFTAGSDTTVLEDCGSKTLTGWATNISAGASNEVETLTFHVQADIAALFSAQPAIDAEGNLTFTPAENANGTGVITVWLSDEGGKTSGTITFKINITAVNDEPVAYNLTTGLNTDEDQELKGSLKIFDPDKDTITYELVSGDAHNVTTLTTASGGTVTLNAAAGTFVYVPYKDYFAGPETFSYRVYDGTAYSNDAQVSIALSGINDPPVAADGTLTVDEDAKDAEATLAGLVTDVDNATLSYSITNPPNQGGTVTLNAGTGAYTYTAAKDYFGSERFTFRAFDGTTYSNTATVTVTINSINDAPSAQDETIYLDEGKTLNGSFKATDIENDAITYSVVTEPASGSLTLTDADTGAYTYTPAAMTTEPTVTVTAVFKAEDPSGDSTNATVTIVVRNINDAPYLDEDTCVAVTTPEDSTLNGSVAAKDPDGDTLIYTVLNGVNHGTLTEFDTADGSFTYVPYANYHGMDFFTFIAKEDREENALSTGIYRVCITVTPVNDPPTAYNLYYYTDTDEETPPSLVITPVGYDPDGDALTYNIKSTSSSEFGSFVNNGNGTFTYTPKVSSAGKTDTVLYTVTDSNGAESANASIFVHIYGSGTGGGLNSFIDRSIQENTSTESIPITVSDITIQSVSITSSNTWLLDNDTTRDIVVWRMKQSARRTAMRACSAWNRQSIRIRAISASRPRQTPTDRPPSP